MTRITNTLILAMWLLSEVQGLVHPVSLWALDGIKLGSFISVQLTTGTCDNDADLCHADYAVAPLMATTAIPAYLDEARLTSLAYGAILDPLFPAKVSPRDPFVVVEKNTIEKPFGLVFFYNCCCLLNPRPRMTSI